MRLPASFIVVFLLGINLHGQVQSQRVRISDDNKWHLWTDTKAEWVNDPLFLPPVDIKKIPVNIPTVGWDSLWIQESVLTFLPSTVEEHFWDQSGNHRGISGNYVGVSWFYRTLEIPADWNSGKIFLDFESVRLRAEIFVNRELAGYDLINGTPFSIDITEYIRSGEKNEIAIRITDPNGNFAWRDWDAFRWGNNLIPPSHGFGGITGHITLRRTGTSFIDNVFIKNSPNLKEVTAEFSVCSSSETPVSGEITYSIIKEDDGKVVQKGTLNVDPFTSTTTVSKLIKVNNAIPWSVENPQLYNLEFSWEGSDNSSDRITQHFGFRYFEVKEINGDRMFLLNGKRIVVISAISWGHWPVNGIFPNDEQAKQQIVTAKELGLNMLHFHRGIGQTSVLNWADKLGLLYYEEPGGFKPNDSELLKSWKREKLLRMVRRDRNHPSLVIYNYMNESNREPFENEIEDMKAAHALDGTRMITFTSTFFGNQFHGGSCPLTPAPFKAHMLPYDKNVYDYGLWDEHHAGGPGVYRDIFYNGPDDIYRHYNNPKEIILLGEDGAIGSVPRLDLIRDEIQSKGLGGWDSRQFLEQYDAFDTYLTENGFRKAFPDNKSLFMSIGEVSHYYQGRTIENFRIGNTGDGYVINGWESSKIENHSGIVDVYRNSKADPSILAHYTSPLYIAVKLREKVLEVGENTEADFYIINEKDLKGRFQLNIEIEDPSGNISRQTTPVNISGGNRYGELLVSNIKVSPTSEGYTSIRATLTRGKDELTQGEDKIFAVNTGVVERKVAIVDTSGTVASLLGTIPGTKFREYERGGQVMESVMVVGKNIQPGFVKGRFRQDDPVLDWVSAGNTLVIISGAEEWARYLEEKEVLEYRGSRLIDRNWFGGNYFVREHKLFDGLPVNTAFNWEYQSLAHYDLNRIGLRLPDGESIAGVWADSRTEVYTAVTVIPVGAGRIILSTLDLEGAILSGEKASVVARRILRNYLSFQ
jgi:beta-galactosidase